MSAVAAPTIAAPTVAAGEDFDAFLRLLQEPAAPAKPMVSSVDDQAPQTLDAKGRRASRGDSEGTVSTVANSDDDDPADEPLVARASVVIHEDNSVHFKSVPRVASNLQDLVSAQEQHQADVAGGTGCSTTAGSNRGHQDLTYNDDMVTINEESGCDPEGGRGNHQAAEVCDTVEPPQQVKDPSKSKVRWGSVLVRDYPIILGDNPCCSCGPPVTLDWEYQEYKPLDVDTYEFAHPPRRSFRELARNYYQRKSVLYLAGFTESDFKQTKKEVNRVKFQRGITRSVAMKYPLLLKVDDAVESAGRKCKRLLKNDHWKSEKSLYNAN